VSAEIDVHPPRTPRRRRNAEADPRALVWHPTRRARLRSNRNRSERGP
jgi:hypothetical protein